MGKRGADAGAGAGVFGAVFRGWFLGLLFFFVSGEYFFEMGKGDVREREEGGRGEVMGKGEKGERVLSCICYFFGLRVSG